MATKGCAFERLLSKLHPYSTSFRIKYVTVIVHYEMYDGIPLIVKWLEVNDTSGRGDIDLVVQVGGDSSCQSAMVCVILH